MIVFTVIGIAFVTVAALNLAMTKWDNHKLRQRLGKTVPFEEYSPFPPRQLKPYEPPSWQPDDEDLRDIPPE